MRSTGRRSAAIASLDGVRIERDAAMAIEFYRLILGCLVVWRLSHLFYGEDGPWNSLVQLRQWAGPGALGAMLDCFYCLSLWLAVPIAIVLGDDATGRLLLWPALSAGAILLERWSAGAQAPVDGRAAVQFEENDHVLR